MVQDASELWNTDNVQTMDFFTSLVKSGSDNCLADNRWSAVQCQQAKRDLSMSKGKAQAARMPSDPSPAAPAPATGVVAAIKNAAAGETSWKMPVPLRCAQCCVALGLHGFGEEVVCVDR